MRAAAPFDVKSFLSGVPVAALLCACPASRACGPDFPNSYLCESADGVASLPTLGFAFELRRMLPADGTVSRAGADQDKAADAERGEVRECLVAAGLASGQVEACVASYDRHRPCAQLPAEFHLYARGANAWARGDTAQSIQAWNELLALPQKDRHYRTVWSAYMLGRALMETRPGQARAAFEYAREAAAHGFADSQGLAAASLGWEARSLLLSDAYNEAIHLYLAQFTLGEPTALPSLQRTVRYAFLGEAADPGAAGAPLRLVPPCGSLGRLARDRQARGVVAAWFLSRGGPYAPWGEGEEKQLRRWIDVLHETRDLGADEAGQWAYACYQCGLWDDARRFASAAPSDGALGEWVRAMLLLRDGFVDEAAAHLANAARAFPRDADQDFSEEVAGAPDAPWSALHGVEGVLALSRDHFTDALRIFLESEHWADAAFVAERVLSLEELLSFVQAEAPAARMPAASPRETAANQLRYLLARRLVRAGRFDQARAFFPDEVLRIYDPYVAAVRAGFDAARPADARAASLWAAAEAIHEHGMEIMGTELEPDYSIWDGNFQWPDIGAERYAGVSRDPYASGHYIWADTAAKARVLAPSDAELRRVFSRVPPSRRFHYRARASELAWLAAGLLPNNDARTACILDTAGRWIAKGSPQEADLFYKALVVRCPETPEGRRASKAHWFGPEAATGDIP